MEGSESSALDLVPVFVSRFPGCEERTRGQYSVKRQFSTLSEMTSNDKEENDSLGATLTIFGRCQPNWKGRKE
jgi:hypothetical protein